ncbi:MAG: hypothetical protein QME12_02265 [Nanoarchaeota archaeon]|nr:hypothetical protein [Nanoarchaeota archaeon]
MTKNSLKDHSKHARSPNLNTIMMVEDILKQSYQPLSMPELKKKLPKQVMHQTLKVVLHYLWKSGKITHTPNGIQWSHVEPEHTKQPEYASYIG